MVSLQLYCIMKPAALPANPLASASEQSCSTRSSEVLPKSKEKRRAQTKMGDPPAHPGYAESWMNLTLTDPPKWGWTAVGGIADVLSPHEVRGFFVLDPSICAAIVSFVSQLFPLHLLLSFQFPQSLHVLCNNTTIHTHTHHSELVGEAP